MRSVLLLLAAAPSALAACANDCSGHGLCNVYSSCECYRNWMGNDCSRRLCYYGRAFVDTPQGDLNSNGKLDTAAVPSRTTNVPTYEGFPLDYAAGAGAATAWSEGHFYAECSNKGTCDRSTGLCECWPGYEGSGCARLSCPSADGSTCSGHGTCQRLADLDTGDQAYNGWDSEKTQRCVCDAGYTGIMCNQRVCPSGDDPVTKYVKLTTICMKMETQPSETVHQEDMPIYNIGAHATGKKTVIGSKSGATATIMKKADNDWNVFENGVAKALKEKPGCALVADVSGQFVKGEQIMLTGTGEALTAQSHNDKPLVVNSITQATYTNAKQANEVQRIAFKPVYVHDHDFTDVASATNDKPTATEFALTFVDEFGESYTTRTILGGMTENKKISELMADIESALQELPNSAVVNVQMHMVASHTDGTYTTACPSDGENPTNANIVFIAKHDTSYDASTSLNAAADAGTSCDFFAFDITFVSNSGNVPALSAYTATGANNFYTVTVTEHTPGTTENVECSNRGHCDASSGLCKCFQGFTGHDCSRQNVLAMY